METVSLLLLPSDSFEINLRVRVDLTFSFPLNSEMKHVRNVAEVKSRK